MILTQTLSFIALSLTLGNPYNTFYQYGAQVETTINCDVNIDSSNTQEAVYFEPYIRFYCDASYDDYENYYLTNFRFRLYVDSYRLPRGADDGILIQSNYVDYEPDWEITQNNYNNQLDRLFCVFETDLGNDQITLGWFYDGQYILEATQSFEFTYTGNYIASSTFSFNGNSFFNKFVNYLNNGYQDGYDVGFGDGRNQGYSEGLQDGVATNGEMFTIFNGILNVAAIPINVFLAIFNFEVFGINITSLVSALLSVAILIIVIRIITGKKSE